MKLVSSQRQKNEEVLEKTLRPQSFSEFPGQNKVKKKLTTFIEASLKRKEALDHVLFSGPPGLGKTTLAYLVSKKMNSEIRSISGPVLKKKGDLAALLTSLKPYSILFIDEIHRISKDIEEYLYSAMEDYSIDIITGEGLGARPMKFQLAQFTLIGATTRTGLLKRPFLDRFGILENLVFYKEEDLKVILKRSSQIMNIGLEDKAAMEIASRSRKTPRIANRLLRRVRDYAQVSNKNQIDYELCCYALDELEVDQMGLDNLDRRILSVMYEQFCNSPVGISTLASILSEEVETLEEVYEPFLLQQGLIQKTPKGRILTPKAKTHLETSLKAKQKIKK